MRLVAALLCLTFAFAGTARADAATDEAKASFAEGSQHYRLGRFGDALASYQRAYEAKPLPAFLFNIGQCHFNLGQYERAVFFYESFLREKSGSANAEVAEEQLAEARRLYAAEQAEEAARLESQRTEERAQLEAAERERVEQERRLEQDRRLTAEAESEALAARAGQGGPDPWLLWTGVGATAAVLTAAAVGSAVLVITLSTPRQIVPPTGTLGTIDTRGEADSP